MKVTVVDDLHPEDAAMVQALYSRSPASVEEHLEKVRRVGSGKFMQQYYVGYGHASIGDCGDTNVFVEGVSTIVAKAIQDWPLYSGQEASTRYMDFSSAGFDDPAGTPASLYVQERWLALYARCRPLVHQHLATRYHRRPGEDVATYDRALVARTFDVCRAFLPAGVRTNLSWSTNLRQLGDKVGWLLAHPHAAVREVGRAIDKAARAKYEHSFGDRGVTAARDAWRELVSAMCYYHVESVGRLRHGDVFVSHQVDRQALAEAVGPAWRRPAGAELPYWAAEVGTVRSEFLLDYGSFRDLQRHRPGTIRMPLLSTAYGFHPWYLEQLPCDLRAEVEAALAQQKAAVAGFVADGLPTEEVQNYVAMGYCVPCRVTQPLPAFVYRVELRTRKTVHPTLRHVAQAEARWFQVEFPEVPVHVDLDQDDWDMWRGGQTISEREDVGRALDEHLAEVAPPEVMSSVL